MRRVVVTGLGLVTPLGVGHQHNWSRLINSESGVRGIQSFDVSDLPAKIAGLVPPGERAAGLFNADDYVPAKDRRKMDDFIVYAIAAATEAVRDAGWEPTDEEERERTGVGRVVEVSMQDATYASLASNLGMLHARGDAAPARTGNRHGGKLVNLEHFFNAAIGNLKPFRRPTVTGDDHPLLVLDGQHCGGLRHS